MHLALTAILATGALALLDRGEAHAASFSCAAAKTLVEHAICDQPDISAQDDALSALYKAKRAQGDDGALLSSQREWLATRNRCRTVECVRASYQTRLAALRSVSSASVASQHWSASTSTAIAITGDMVLGPEFLKMAKSTFQTKLVAKVSSFQMDTGSFPTNIYAVLNPMNPAMKSGNTLCGAPVRWFAISYVDAAELRMAAFSGLQQPRSLHDKGACGTYGYSRP